MCKRVLIASCIRQTPEILSEFLEGLTRLEKPFDVDYYFILDTLPEESREAFDDWRSQQNEEIFFEERETEVGYPRSEITHVWSRELIRHVTEMKNQVLDHARERGYDYLFLSDSDQVYHPETLTHLLERDRDIVGVMSWAKWTPQEHPMPNAWFRHPYDFDGRMLELREKTLHKVKGFGGCYLLSREALESNVNYSYVEGYPDNWGEDRYFAVRAEEAGYDLYVDGVYPYFHIYRESDLPRLREWIERGYREPRVEVKRGTVLIGVCVGEKGLHPDTTAWITRTLRRHRDWALEISRAHPIDSNRNMIVRKFMLLPQAQSYEWLLFLDTDVVPPEGAVERLLSHGVNIVGGVCPIMGESGLPTWNISKDIEPGVLKAELMEVEGMGTGFILMHRSVLRDVGHPAFRFRYDPWGTASICGEDYDFCEKAVEEGYRIYADLGIQCRHYKEVDLLNLNRQLSDIINRERRRDE